MKKFIEEFKAFALKGNMVDLAVGMIIGSAFTSIVNSLVNDIFMPVLSIFTGKIDFSNMFIALDGNKYPTLEAAKEVTATINYGSFITQTINFLLMALVVFLAVKAISRLEKIGKQPETSALGNGRRRGRPLFHKIYFPKFHYWNLFFDFLHYNQLVHNHYFTGVPCVHH